MNTKKKKKYKTDNEPTYLYKKRKKERNTKRKLPLKKIEKTRPNENKK